jgi:hypothetical protein
MDYRDDQHRGNHRQSTANAGNGRASLVVERGSHRRIQTLSQTRPERLRWRRHTLASEN